MDLDPFLHLYNIAPQRHDHAAVKTLEEVAS